MKRLALLLLLTVVPAYGQTLQIDVGSSTLFNATGAGATLYRPNQTLNGSLGYANGHVVYGASDAFRRGDYEVTLGDRQIGFSFDGAGLGLLERGVSIDRQNDTSTVSAFVGTTSFGYNTPYLATAGMSHLGLGLYGRRKVSHFEFNGLGVINGGQRTVLGGLRYDQNRLKASLAAGILQNAKYLTGTAGYQSSSFALTVSHQEVTLTQHSSSSSISGGWTLPHVNLQANVMQGTFKTTVIGEEAGLGLRFGPIATQSSWFHSGRSSFLTNAISEHVSRFQLVQSISGRNVSVGGSYTSNRFALSVSQAVLFIPGTGFRLTNLVQLSFHVHDASVNLGTVVDPLGKVRWTTYGTTFAQTGVQTSASHRMTGHLIEGYVRGTDGEGVEGIAIRLQNDVVYSGSSGYFAYRTKHNSAALTVSLEESVAPGTWEITSCPTEATPGMLVTVGVRRK